jgi:hypothetical protein
MGDIAKRVGVSLPEKAAFVPFTIPEVIAGWEPSLLK